MIKSFKVRLLPTPDQEERMWQHVGASRFIYNYMLEEQMRRYEAGEKHLSAFDMNKLLTPLKKQDEYAWLNGVSNTTLKNSCADLSKAYDRFFTKLSRHPKFKSRKRSRASFPVRETAYFKNGCAYVEKIGKVAYKTNYDLPQGKGHKFINPRISNDNGKWILTFGMECESQAPILTDKPMGIDVGVKDLAVVAFGDEQIVFHNINKSKRVRTLERKKRHIQRAISRKYRTNGSYAKTKGIEKYERILKTINYKLACIRKDYIHQTTHALVSMLPRVVCVEDLNVIGMMKNRHLSKAIQDQSLGEFFRQMEYKCAWNGIELVKVGRFYPSSKTCSCCGEVKHDLKLSERTYKCPRCGLVIDRDYNAAINLMKYAGSQTRAAA